MQTVTTPSQNLIQLLEMGLRKEASDLIVVAGSPPCFYVNGVMQPFEMPALVAREVEQLLTTPLTEAQLARLHEHQDLDFSIDLPQSGQCRANIHYQRGTMAGAFRYIPRDIPSLDELNLPPILKDFAMLPQGLILVTGATGHGKSTTLAAMLEHINQNVSKHIITLEDPVEFRFVNQKSVIEQREIGKDAPSFASALRHALRQRMDVIFVGEMRDAETVATAITAAETGHLVLGTLHTMSAAYAVDRIIDAFDGIQQQHIRLQLAHTLQGIVSQILFPDIRRPGLVAATEILVATSAVRRAIRDSETHLIPGMIETGFAQGMQTMDHTIIELFVQGQISKAEALTRLTSQKSIEILNNQAPVPGDAARQVGILSRGSVSDSDAMSATGKRK